MPKIPSKYLLYIRTPEKRRIWKALVTEAKKERRSVQEQIWYILCTRLQGRKSMRLREVVREVGGWPIKLDDVAAILEAADEIFADKGGKDIDLELSDDDVTSLLETAAKKRAIL